MLFVAAAGNSGSNNDVVPAYPASYTAPNVISVAATDNRDRLASFSNFGPATVHLGAPGVNVLSTVRGGGYAWASGTSMAAPHVSGAALLALSACNLTTSGVKSVLLDTVDQVLAGWTATGGRLNAEAALRACTAGAPLDFSLAAVPASVTVKRGGTAVYSVSIASQGGFANQVSFSVSGLPRNATASFSPASVVAPGSTTLTVVTSSTRGTFGLTITGTSGGLVHATQVGLTVVK
jgi:subtilisin family serine protease